MLRLFQLLCICLTMVTLVGCASSTSSIEAARSDDGDLGAPKRAVVYDFAATPSDIPSDSPVYDRYTSRPTEQSDQEIALGRELGSRIGDRLVINIRNFGLPADRRGASLPPQRGDVIVRGEIVSIDEGSRTRRMLIGFGSGAAQLQAFVEVYQLDGVNLIPVGSGTVEARGGRMPGILVL